jgi:polyhydroxybutyrate depolymerase
MVWRICVVLAAVATVVSGLTAVSANAASAAESGGRGGCAPALPTGQTTVHITSGGLDRLVVVYLPERLASFGHRPPAVLTLHGSQSTALEQLDRSQLEGAADADGFVLAAPQGALPAPPGYRWFVPYVTGPSGPDDEQFLIGVINYLAGSACVDTGRVYATGYSGGGRMVSAFACDHPDRIAALIAVAGLRAGAPVSDGAGGYLPDPATCAPSRPLPVLAFGGTADPVNPFGGGGAPYWGYGYEAAAARWAVLNGCQSAPATREVTEHVSSISYRACKANADVVLYVVAGGGHTWPGSSAFWPPELGPVTTEISANDILWSFVRTRVTHPA